MKALDVMCFDVVCFHVSSMSFLLCLYSVGNMHGVYVCSAKGQIKTSQQLLFLCCNAAVMMVECGVCCAVRNCCGLVCLAVHNCSATCIYCRLFLLLQQAVRPKP